MNALEIALIGLVILLGAAAIVYAGLRARKPASGSAATGNSDGSAPIIIAPHGEPDTSDAGGGDSGGGGGDGGGGGGGGDGGA